MKLACLVDTDAPPTVTLSGRRRRSERPRAPPGGFVNTLPQFGSAIGCVSRRRRARCVHRRPDLPGVPGAQGEAEAATTTVAGERRRQERYVKPHFARVGRPSVLARRARRRPSAPTTSPIARPCAPAFIRTAPTEARRDRHPEAPSPARPCCCGDPGEGGQRHRAARRHTQSPRARSDQRNPRPQAHHEPGETPRAATRTFDPLPKTATARWSLATARATAWRPSTAPGSRKIAARTADPEGGQGSHRDVGAHPVPTRLTQDRACLVDRSGHPSSSSMRSRTASPSIQTSPQPIVTTRSPPRTSSAR